MRNDGAFRILIFTPYGRKYFIQMSEEKNKHNKNWKEINSKYFQVLIRFNKEEQSKFKPLWENSGIKYAGTFIKKCIFFGGSDYKDVENKYNELEELYKTYIDNLRRIGTNINQISMKLNHINFINDGEKELLFESLEELKGEIFDFRKRKKLHE